MSRIAWVVILAIVFFVTLVVTAPARLLSGFIPANQLILQGYSGTVWRGSASRAMVLTEAGYFQLGQIHWSLRPLSLLVFSPSLEIHSNWGKQKLHADVRISGKQSLELENLDALFSVYFLRKFLPVAVEGEISAQFDQLDLEAGLPVIARGRVVWQNAAWSSNQGSNPLGTYAIDFTQQAGGPLNGQLITLAGEVEASGSVVLDGQHYALDLLVGAEKGLDEQLKQALSLIAQEVPGGYRVKFDGQLITK